MRQETALLRQQNESLRLKKAQSVQQELDLLHDALNASEELLELLELRERTIRTQRHSIELLQQKCERLQKQLESKSPEAASA